MTLRPVFVRGVGAVTAFGLDWPRSVAALREGRSAVGPVGSFDATGFPCTVAAELPRALTDQLARREDRRIALAERAGAEAWAMAGVKVGDARRLGIFMGAESGRATFATVVALAQRSGSGAHFDHDVFGREARPLAARVQFEGVSPAAVTSFLARAYGAEGPCQTVSLACSSSAVAIAEAARAIRLGVCDIALCGGVGADADPLMLAGFGKVGALSARGISCPFDVRRDGFVVGEGAAMVVLSAEKGSAAVELAGEGRSLDAFHLTAPDPEGRGAERSMRAALKLAGPVTVDYVQAHGTSTPLNDAVEAMALRRVLGDEAAARTPVSSVKGALGHWIAGAGALGFLCAWEAVSSGTLLPTAGLETPDPECGLNFIRGRAVQARVGAALVNSFAFGGANCSLVVRHV